MPAIDLLIGARSLGWRHQELADGVDGADSLFAAGAVDLAELAEAGVDDASAFCFSASSISALCSRLR